MRELEAAYYQALQVKHPKAAILTEVTVPDEQAEYVYRSYNARNSPYYRRYYLRKNLPIDAEIPEDYSPLNVKLSRRIDYLIFEGQTITAVEMKISKADFRRDTEEKRAAWKSVTNRFAYLTPKGLLTVEEIPEGCGLWEYENGVITIVKKAKTNKTPLPLPLSMVKYFAWRTFLAENPHRKYKAKQTKKKKR